MLSRIHKLLDILNKTADILQFQNTLMSHNNRWNPYLMCRYACVWTCGCVNSAILMAAPMWNLSLDIAGIKLCNFDGKELEKLRSHDLTGYKFHYTRSHVTPTFQTPKVPALSLSTSTELAHHHSLIQYTV